MIIRIFKKNNLDSNLHNYKLKEKGKVI